MAGNLDYHRKSSRSSTLSSSLFLLTVHISYTLGGVCDVSKEVSNHWFESTNLYFVVTALEKSLVGTEAKKQFG